MLNEKAARSNGRKLKVKQCKKDVRKHSFSLRAISDWNSLPVYVVSAPFINSFKNNLIITWEIQSTQLWFKKQEGVI